MKTHESKRESTLSDQIEIILLSNYVLNYFVIQIRNIEMDEKIIYYSTNNRNKADQVYYSL